MTTQAQILDFGEWLPDLPESENPGALIMRNVIPQLKSYRSLNSLTSFTNALTGACLGSFWTPDDANVINNFCGDATKLYELSGGDTWNDVSGASGPFGAASWEFTKFGNRVIATDFADVIQKWDLSSDSVFIALPGSPPKARRIATVRDFVMLGDIDGLGPNFVQWSGYNNSELWAPSLASQSDSQELFGRGGKVQRIVPGEYGIIFLEQSIFRADYSGPPLVFQFNEIERKRGTPAPNSVVWSGNNIWYYGWDGFYHFDGVNPSEPISANRVARWFALNSASDVHDSMRGALDRLNRLVMWGFKSSSASLTNDRLIIYNWAADKWSYAEIDTQLIDEFVSPGFTLDELDTPLPAGIDTDSILVDSTQFAGGGINLIAFDNTNKTATFDGAALAAQMDTKELSTPDNQLMFTNSVRPMIEGSPTTAVTVQVGTRNKLQDNTTFGVAKGQNGINGEINLRVKSRYQRFRLNVTGGFTHGNGAKVQTRFDGGRR